MLVLVFIKKVSYILTKTSFFLKKKTNKKLFHTPFELYLTAFFQIQFYRKNIFLQLSFSFNVCMNLMNQYEHEYLCMNRLAFHDKKGKPDGETLPSWVLDRIVSI